MANDPEQTGQPVSGGAADAGGQGGSSPGTKRPPSPDTSSESPAQDTQGASSIQSAPGQGGDASSCPGEKAEAPSPPDVETHDSRGQTESSDPGNADVHVPDPAYEGYPEHHHHDDPYHHDPAHDDPHHYDGHHEDPFHHTVEDGSQPHGDYYHEPGAYDTGSGSSGYHHHEEKKTEEDVGFDGLFGGEEDGEGGPVKPFLDHLEDLRWVIIRCIAAVLIAMVVCLVATPLIVALLKWPLQNPIFYSSDTTNSVVRVRSGTNVMRFEIASTHWGPLPLATNQVNTFDIVPVLTETNILLTLQPVTNAPPERDLKLPIINVRSVPASFAIAIQIALWGGAGLASPFVMLFIGQFIVPALKTKERDYLYRGVIVGAGLFLAGVAFCYFVVMRVAILATVQFANWMGFASEIWDADAYISFCVKFMVGMGLCFQVPVFLLTLVKIGILDHHRLNAFRPYWIIANLILCAFITPSGDPFSMMLMAAPIHLLYEISVLIAWWWDRQDRKREALEKTQ